MEVPYVMSQTQFLRKSESTPIISETSSVLETFMLLRTVKFIFVEESVPSNKKESFGERSLS